MKTGAHLACRHYENAWNIDGLLHDKSRGLVHDISNTWLRADTSQCELCWCHSFSHFFHDLLLDIIGEQASRIRQDFVLLDDLIRRLRNLTFGLVGEDGL